MLRIMTAVTYSVIIKAELKTGKMSEPYIEETNCKPKIILGKKQKHKNPKT